MINNLIRNGHCYTTLQYCRLQYSNFSQIETITRQSKLSYGLSKNHGIRNKELGIRNKEFIINQEPHNITNYQIIRSHSIIELLRNPEHLVEKKHEPLPRPGPSAK